MDTLTSNDMAKSASSVVDQASDKLRSGLRDAQQNSSSIGATVAKTVDDFGRNARHRVDSGTEQVKHGIDSLRDSLGAARDKASSSADSVLRYTQENPVKALMLAAASGVVLWTVLKAVGPSRDR